MCAQFAALNKPIEGVNSYEIVPEPDSTGTQNNGCW